MSHAKLLSQLENFKRPKNIKDFHDFDIREFEKLLSEKEEAFWEVRGERKALRLFHEAGRDPLSKTFLQN